MPKEDCKQDVDKYAKRHVTPLMRILPLQWQSTVSLTSDLEMRAAPYVHDEINEGVLKNKPVRVRSYDVGIHVSSLTYDLAKESIGFVIDDFTFALTLDVREMDFANVMIATVSGDVSKVLSTGEIISNLRVSVQQGERNAPDLARKLVEDLDEKVAETSVNTVGPAIRWLRDNG